MVRPRTETVYDALGRRVMVRENLKQTGLGESATIDETDVRETHYEYDSSGRLAAVGERTRRGAGHGARKAIVPGAAGGAKAAPARGKSGCKNQRQAKRRPTPGDARA